MGKYTHEMVEFIRQHRSEMTYEELTRLFNDKFKTQKTVESMRWACRSRGIKGIDRSFQKGVCPHKNTKYKVGDECFLAGEWRVITSTEEKKQILQRSEYKKRVIWEEAYGKIPEGHCFIYLDGNKKNCSLDNLACVPLLWMRILNQNGWLNGNKEVTLTALKWCELHYSLSVKDGERYVKNNGKRYR